MMKLFDSHCHLQDPRIINMAPEVIKTALNKGVSHFAVNGVSEKDWGLVKEMSDKYPSVIPNFGLHPWFVADRTPNWMNVLKEFFDAAPAAAVGEIGLDKGSKGRLIDFNDQIEVFRLQLQLAKDLKRPASVHCVRAFGDLLDVMKSIGPFPAGVILHSYLGSAELVPELAKLGAYFSFSGFLMSLKESKAKKILKSIPQERILLETDSPDALPNLTGSDTLFLIEKEVFVDEQKADEGQSSTSTDSSGSVAQEASSKSNPKNDINHPANIHHILSYAASLLEMSNEELASISYQNAINIFSYEGSKVL